MALYTYTLNQINSRIQAFRVPLPIMRFLTFTTWPIVHLAVLMSGLWTVQIKATFSSQEKCLGNSVGERTGWHIYGSILIQTFPVNKPHWTNLSSILSRPAEHCSQTSQLTGRLFLHVDSCSWLPLFLDVVQSGGFYLQSFKWTEGPFFFMYPTVILGTSSSEDGWQAAVIWLSNGGISILE